jgi:hypothetical protein
VAVSYVGGRNRSPRRKPPRGIDFVSFYDFLLDFGTVPTVLIFFYFYFITETENSQILELEDTS